MNNKNLITVSEMIKNLKNFWSQYCAIIEGTALQVGAGTLCPETALMVAKKESWNICQVQQCIRPSDAREGMAGNRISKYFQMQILLKPIPNNFRQIVINSLKAINLTSEEHDIRFIEDNWKNPSIGAAGVGFEVWCDGMEVLQFTYMQKMGGVQLKQEAVEVTLGLERLALFLQEKDNIFDLQWNEDLLYKDIYPTNTEADYAFYNFYYQEDTEELKIEFEKTIHKTQDLINRNKYYIGYEFALKASHTLNILDARGVLGEKDRTSKLLQIRELVAQIITATNS